MTASGMRYVVGMSIRIDRKTFDLSPGLVRAKLHEQTPEAVKEYWVEIDGLRWPVKQVIALATGVSNRRRFKSKSARRWLQELGFEVGGISTSLSGKAPQRSRSRRASFEAESLKVLDQVRLSVDFSWLRAGSVSLDSASLPLFPQLPRTPGLYRFDFGMDADGMRLLYIGESVNLERRASNYRNAKIDRKRQRTSRRIHKEIVAHLVGGGSIEFDVAVHVEALTHGEVDLRLASGRRVAENAAVLLAQLRPGLRVLNIDADLPQGPADA